MYKHFRKKYFLSYLSRKAFFKIDLFIILRQHLEKSIYPVIQKSGQMISSPWISSHSSIFITHMVTKITNLYSIFYVAI